MSLPYLVGNVVELLDAEEDDDADDTAGSGIADKSSSGTKGKCAVIKTTSRQNIFLPLVGLVDPD
jgi:26S proteasome regulatory subunit T5